MKKSIIAGLALLSFSTILKAQESGTDTRENIEFGVKAGINYSNVWDAQGQDFVAKGKVGFAGGVFLGIPLGEFFGVQPEALISQKGFQGSGTLYGFPYSFSRTTTYFDIPILFQVKPLQYLTLLAGPEYSYLIHETDNYTYGLNSSEQQQAFSNDNIRKNIFGIEMGADVIISHLVFSGRLGWDLQTNNGNGTSSTPRYKNQWAQLTVGFKI
jgi:hypothetical protein